MVVSEEPQIKKQDQWEKGGIGDDGDARCQRNQQNTANQGAVVLWAA
jgi:hypothetical protein